MSEADVDLGDHQQRGPAEHREEQAPFGPAGFSPEGGKGAEDEHEPSAYRHLVEHDGEEVVAPSLFAGAAPEVTPVAFGAVVSRVADRGDVHGGGPVVIGEELAGAGVD